MAAPSRRSQGAVDGLCILQQIAHHPISYRAPLFDDHVALGQLAGDEQVLFHQDDGALGREPADGLHHLLDDDRRQSLARLVDKQQAVVGHQRPGDGQHLLLPARQVSAGQLDQSLQVGKETKDELFLALQVALAPLGDAQVLLDAQVAKDGAVFGDKADAHGGNLEAAPPLNFLIGQHHLPLPRRRQPQDRL